MALPKDFSKVDYHEGIVRTDCDCHSCSGRFIAKLNYDIDGDHRVVCPRCGHIHYRTIQKGVVTETRWNSRPQEKEFVEVKTELYWRDDALEIETATPAAHIRSRFLDK
jgi:DNA-directed RNA polymerase subunit RPC12/RpoP